MRQAFWKTFRHTLVPLGIICHYLFSRSALDFSLITWLASWALPRVHLQGQFVFTAGCFLCLPHRKTIFPECGVRIKGNFHNTHGSYCSQEPLGRSSRLPHGAQVSLATPQGMSRPLCPVKDASDSKAKNVLDNIFFLERKPFEFWKPLS